MGDYNVQIVSARLRGIKDPEEFKSEVLSRAPLLWSAYHGAHPSLSINRDEPGLGASVYINLVTQFKYNVGADEFLDWLEPYVVQGMGEDCVWAINYSEHSHEPTIRALGDKRYYLENDLDDDLDDDE